MKGEIKMKKEDNIVWTIEELYKWACENKIQDYTVFISDEGTPCNIYKSETIIDKNRKTVLL